MPNNNKSFRIESDFIGKKQLPHNALFGINALRASENFPKASPFNKHWYKAAGTVKLAYYLTIKKFKEAAKTHFPIHKSAIRLPDDNILDQLIISAREISEGKYFMHFIVPAIQGGAGTAANMNINEIISNSALLRMGKQPGDYDIINPFEDANIFQSTNDVMPTALKLAAMQLLNDLEEGINGLRAKIETKEKEYRHVPRIAHTQLQAAVPSSYGLLFGGYSEMLSRDWWRVSKCFERIKSVNLGGGAAGTSLAVPTYIVMQTARELRDLSGLPISGSENLQDTTANTDTYTEVHAILKAHAVNLEKIANDLRLLASDINREQAVKLPPRQTGSSLMPGKVNPIIPEYIISCAQKIQANDLLISQLCAKGNLDLNAYLPLIGDALLESLELLTAANQSAGDFMVEGLQIQEDQARRNFFRNPSLCTAFNPYIGYKKAAQIAEYMKIHDCDIFDASETLAFLNKTKTAQILASENLLKAGFSLKDILRKK